MGDTNRVGLFFVEEETWGTTPASALQTLRYNSEDLGFNIANIRSNEIRDDRQISDLIQTGAEAGGSINFELSYGTFDSFLEGALFSDWVGVGGGSTEEITSGATASGLDFVLDATAETITLGASITHDIDAGQWIELEGTTGDDGYHFVTDVSGQVLTVQSLTTSETLTETEAAKIKGARLRNGTTKKSYTIERKYNDLSPVVFFAFLGMVIDQMSLDVYSEAVATGSFSFLGKDVNTGSATVGTGAATAATTTDVLNAVANVGQIMEGSTLTAMTGVYIQSLSINVGNNLRGRKAIGVLGNSSVGAGSVNVTGSMNVYFENTDLYDKYVNNTDSGFSFKFEDSTGNAYVFTAPRIKFSTGSNPTPGKDDDVMLNLEWEAIKHATYGYTFEISRFAA